MNIEKWETLEYTTVDGDCPLLKWLETLPVKKSSKVLEDIKRFELYGPRHKPGFSEKLSEHISYIRTKQGGDIFRTFWFQWHGRIAVLTHGYQKKQDKASRREIQKAEIYRRDWLKRYGKRRSEKS